MDATIAQKGHLVYTERLRSLVDTAENLGKIIAIDIDSGDYEIDADLLTAGFRLIARRPKAVLWSERIGYDAVYALGAGTLTRVSA